MCRCTDGVGQTLHVTAGTGLVVTRDGRVIVMRPGDDVTWLEHVTDEEYRRAQPGDDR